MRDTDISRRSILKASTGAIGLGAVGAAPASSDETDRSSADRLGPADLDDVETHLETVSAASVPESVDGLGPGSMLFITRDGESGTAGCTANFVWEDGGTRYLGAAGHCFLSGVDAGGSMFGGDRPDLSEVTVEACVDCSFGGATALTTGIRGQVVELGDVVYARQASDDGEAVGYDFGLVEIPEEAEHLISPSMPTWGGPTTDGEINGGDTICQYGNGVVTGETVATKGRTGAGTVNDEEHGSWFAALAAAPGDSGSAVQVAEEQLTGVKGVEAAGILTHLTGSGTAGTNVEKAISMASEVGLDVRTVVVDE